MTQEEMNRVMSNVFQECSDLRSAGQKEYAREDANAFANFERVSDLIDVDRKAVLLTYFYKHIDGIASYVNGYKSQREDVRGRINDAIVYLTLLRGMIDDEEGCSSDQISFDVFEGPSKFDCSAAIDAPVGKVYSPPLSLGTSGSDQDTRGRI